MMSEVRADRLKVGDVVQGHPNKTVVAVERFDKPGWDRQWVRVTLHSPADDSYATPKPERTYEREFPPDWPVDIWPKPKRNEYGELEDDEDG
jgi:hypothetical protein